MASSIGCHLSHGMGVVGFDAGRALSDLLPLRPLANKSFHDFGMRLIIMPAITDMLLEVPYDGETLSISYIQHKNQLDHVVKSNIYCK